MARKRSGVRTFLRLLTAASLIVGAILARRRILAALQSLANAARARSPWRLTTVGGTDGPAVEECPREPAAHGD